VPQPPISSAPPPRTLSPSRPQPAPSPTPLLSRPPPVPPPSRPHPQPPTSAPPQGSSPRSAHVRRSSPIALLESGIHITPRWARPLPGIGPGWWGASRCTCWPRRLPHGPCSRPQSVRLSAPVVLPAPRAAGVLGPGGLPCPRTGGPVVGPPPLPHSCPSPTLTLGARPPGGLMAHVTNLCQRFARGEWKELFKEAVAERRPGARALPPRAFHRATQNAAAARREACIESSPRRAPLQSLTPPQANPPGPSGDDTLAALRRRHPPCRPLPAWIQDYSPPPSLPIPVPTAAALGVPSARHLRAPAGGPLVSHGTCFGCKP